MRETKFRYWDPFNGCMVYSDRFKNLAEFFGNYQLVVDGENKPVLEQYTGLKDKNGVEIYKGDVVEVLQQCPGEQDFIGVVEFIECGFWINAKRICKTESVFQEIATVEIIGNIHENPEILE